MSDHQNQLEDQIAELSNRLENAQLDQHRLRAENAHFRSLMLTNINQISTVDPIYIAQQKNTWKDLPIEKILTFLELFQTHAKIFHEIATEKGGKESIKDHINKVASAKQTAVETYRDNAKSDKTKVLKSPVGAKKRMEQDFNLTEEQSQIWLMLPKEKRNALKGIMKIVGGHFDAALKMLTSQEESAIAKAKS